jgi:hypothetical protein
MYTANSLEDIAQLFDQNAASADARAENPKVLKREQVVCRAAAQTWRQAAETLRNAVIKTPKEWLPS